jgi:Do/DeqQ family serine protease
MKKVFNAESAKIFVAAILGSMLTLGGFACFNREDNKPVFIEKAADFYHKTSVIAGTENPQGDFSAAAEAVIPAVVNIRSTTGTQIARGENRNDNGDEGMDPFEEFFGRRFRDFEMRPRDRGPQKGSGSGVIVSADGYIVTNNHVVENADELEVFLSDKRSYKAKVIGTDPNTDLALVKINATNLPKLAFANSDNVKIGSWAMAVGFPLQLESTVTAGIVSAKGRSIGILQGAEGANRVPVESFIQTDAAINPGNSGGALVNLNGDLIGINTAIASPTGTYAGYGFAIPSNLVSKVIEDILKFGSVQQAYLGVVLGQVDNDAIEKNGLKVQSGVFLDSLVTGGSAASAGLKENDVVLKIDNTPIGTIADIKEKIARHRPGDVINVLVNRKGTETTVRVPLKGLSNNATVVKRERSEAVDALGVEFSNLNADEKKKAGVEYGVKVASTYNGKLREAGVRPGFIITKVNNQPVKSVEELMKAIDKADDTVYLMGKYPNSSQKLIYGFEK